MNLVVGQKAVTSITLTPDHVATYAQLTGDYNPLHFDEAFAAGTKFGGLVVQGGLTTGFLSFRPIIGDAATPPRPRVPCFKLVSRNSVFTASGRGASLRTLPLSWR